MKKAMIFMLLLMSLTVWAAKSDLKPRLVVCTDIAPADVEPDDMESMVMPSASFGGNSLKLAQRK